MISYGFYDSKKHDRRYNAIQFGSIFDGIVRDGVFMSIGTCFRVTPSEDMMVLVGEGRAWFNHTWILNDALLPLTIPQSEVILDRIDAIVIDVNGNENARKNDIIIIKGTPSKTPKRPTLINDKKHHQYPLAYISVGAGVTSIRAADITSMLGTSATPYVTGILDTVNIDNLIDQWRDQWQRFYENQTDDMLKTNDFWKREWRRWYEAQTNEIQDSYEAWLNEWNLWSSNYKTMMEDTAEEWKALWNAWFYSYINENQQMIAEWQKDRDDEFMTWFNSLQEVLDGDVETKIAKRLLELEECCKVAKKFMNTLITEHAVYDLLLDQSWMDYDNIIDQNTENILDSEEDPLIGRNYSNELILDSDGHPIDCRVIFAVK